VVRGRWPDLVLMVSAIVVSWTAVILLIKGNVGPLSLALVFLGSALFVLLGFARLRRARSRRTNESG
jgi:divalent metal cation (Fe/Co/Zn/Cd) transporter